MNQPRSIFLFDRLFVFVGVAFLCLVSGAVVPAKASKNIDAGSTVQNYQRRCFSPEEVQNLVADKDIDVAEFNLTEPICIPVSSATGGLHNAIHNGIPDGVVCNAHNWCVFSSSISGECASREGYSEASVDDASTRSILSSLQV